MDGGKKEERTTPATKLFLLNVNWLPGSNRAKLFAYWLEELLPGNIGLTATSDLKSNSESRNFGCYFEEEAGLYMRFEWKDFTVG